MPLLTANDKPIIYAVRDGLQTIISDMTAVGNQTGVSDSLTAISDTDENAFLGKMIGNGGGYTALPAAGEIVLANEIYRYGDDLVIIRQTHTRTNDAPANIPALILTYRAEQSGALEWVANENVLIGMEREYSGVTYICIQAHTTVEGQTPNITPALWNTIPSSDEWQIGVAYSIGDMVTYQGATYECIQAHTSQVGWQPPNVGIINVLWIAA